MTDDELAALVDEIMARPGPVRLVAVDGRGGAGKTRFAATLSAAAGGAPVVHTDDFASPDESLHWWPLLLAEVIEPLMAGSTCAVAAAPIVIIEGVSAGRREWAEHLSYVIWIETPTDERYRRMVAREGADVVAREWAGYEAEEATHFGRDPVRERADLVVGA